MPLDLARGFIRSPKIANACFAFIARYQFGGLFSVALGDCVVKLMSVNLTS